MIPIATSSHLIGRDIQGLDNYSNKTLSYREKYCLLFKITELQPINHHKATALLSFISSLKISLLPIIDLILLVGTECYLLYRLSKVLSYCSSACCLISWDSPWATGLTKDVTTPEDRQGNNEEITCSTQRTVISSCCVTPCCQGLFEKNGHSKRVFQAACYWYCIYLCEAFFQPWHLPVHQYLHGSILPKFNVIEAYLLLCFRALPIKALPTFFQINVACWIHCLLNSLLTILQQNLVHFKLFEQCAIFSRIPAHLDNVHCTSTLILVSLSPPSRSFIFAFLVLPRNTSVPVSMLF